MSKIKIPKIIFFAFAGVSMAQVALAQTASERTAQAFFFEAEDAMGKNDFQTALSYAEKAQETLGANNALLESIRTRAFFEMGQYPDAKTSLDIFYSLDPSETLSRKLAPVTVKLEGKLAIIERRRAVSAAIQKAGECIVEAKVKAVTKTHSRMIPIMEPSEELVTVPPTFKVVTETIVIQPAARKDATFKTVDEYIVLQEAHTSLETIPAEYESTKVVVPLGVSVSGGVIEKEITRRVRLTEARTTEHLMPAITKTIQVKQVKKKGKSKERLPAVTEQIQRRVLIKPGSAQLRTIPGVSQKVTVEEEISPARQEKVSAMCNYKEDDIVVETLKMKFKEAGQLSGTSEQISAEDLDAALVKFQKKNDLPSVAELTKATYQMLQLSN